MPTVFGQQQPDLGYSLEANKAEKLNREASLLLERGEAQAALKTWQEAEKLYQQSGNIEKVIGIKINQTFALQALGQYREALKILENIDRESINDPLKATADLSRGNALQQIGDLETAWCTLENSLNLLESNQKSVVSQTLKGQIQVSLGNTARFFAKRIKYEQGKSSQQNQAIKTDCKDKSFSGSAKSFYEQAEKYYHQASQLEMKPNQRLSFNLNYLSLLAESDNLPAAENYLAKVWQELETEIKNISPSPAGIIAKINLARSLTQLKNPKWDSKAETILNQAISEAKSLENRRLLSQATGNLGWFYQQRGDFDKALKNTEEALRLSQAILAGDLAYQWQWQLGKIHTAKGEIQPAIEAYKAAVDNLQKVRQNLVSVDADFQKFKSSFQGNFRDEVEPVYRELVGLLLQSSAPGNPKENIKEALGVIELLQLAELENFLLCDLSQVHKLEPAKTIAEAKEKVDKKLQEVFDADPTAAIIYPIILPDRLEVIRVLPNDNLRHVATVVKSKEEIQNKIQQLNKALRKSTEFEEMWNLAGEFHQWLIQPFQQELTNRTVVFVLDMPLRNIPMGALYDKQTKNYLIENNPVALVSSLQLLDLTPSESRIPKALTAGVSIERKVRGTTFRELPSVPKELEQINKILSGSQKLLNQDFTASVVKEQFNSATFPIIHLATHGQFSSRRDLTFIVDGVDSINLDELNSIFQGSNQTTAKDIELLVMSACQTAAGDRQAVLGLAGVAIRAGARSTIASLWAVEDQSTSIFMDNFYTKLILSYDNSTHLKMTKAKALQEAQSPFISAKTNDPNYRYRHPRFWAPFILLGNWL